MTHTPTDLVDHTIGPYHLERLLGQGGFAWLFVGRELDGTPVAVGSTFVKVWEVQNTGSVPWRGRYLQRNKVAFDSRAALEAALASPVRSEMRADFAAFPPYRGRG